MLGVDLAGAFGDLAAGHVHTHSGADLRSGQTEGLGDLVGGELALVGENELGDSVLAGGHSGISLAGLGAGLLVAGVQLGEGVLGELLDGSAVDVGTIEVVDDSGVELTQK